MNDLLNNIIEDAVRYSNQIQDLEAFLNDGNDLSVVPLNVLYESLKNSSPQVIAEALPKLTSERRQLLLDLGFWNKDSLDLEGFYPWLQAYHLTKDDAIKRELVTSSEWALFLKAQLNIWTFDPDDPNYPDHDDYFLTEDNQLLIEFHADFPFVKEVQDLIKVMYSELGVEKAYAHLFKIITDSYSNMEEEGYTFKRSRLEDYGFVDYYKALEIEGVFTNKNELKKFIKTKISRGLKDTSSASTIGSNSVVINGSNDKVGKNNLYNYHDSDFPTSELPPLPALNFLNENTSGNEYIKQLREQLAQIKDNKRLDFLRFNFTKLVNSSIELRDARRQGGVALSLAGEKVNHLLLLGFDYVRDFLGKDEPDRMIIKEKALSSDQKFPNFVQAKREFNIFNVFDFIELYKIGNGLVQLEQRKIKRDLAKISALSPSINSENNEYFMGDYWQQFLEESFTDVLKFKSYKEYLQWSEKVDIFCALLPYMQKAFSSWVELRDSGRVQDSFYLNYTVSSINFESIIISSFANYSLGKGNGTSKTGLGLTLEEVKRWMRIMQEKHDSHNENHTIKAFTSLEKKLIEFKKQFGMENINNFEKYLYDILEENISGYQVDELTYEEWAYVGGPIILAA